MKNIQMMLSIVALLFGLLVYAPFARGQMMGGHTGAMMDHGGGMSSMHDLTSPWPLRGYHPD